MPSEAQIKSAQQATIKEPKAPKTEAAREQKAVRERDARPGKTTAPAAVLELSSKAAKAWLLYRINGDTPPSGVIPRSVWDGVPPASPDERMKGRAMTGGMRAFTAHPQDGGWIVSVSTRDPRLPTIVVEVDGPASSASVKGISG